MKEAVLWRILELVLRLLERIHPPQVLLSLNIGPVTNKHNLTTQHMTQVTITNEQEVVVTLNPRTQAGHPATLDGPPVWQIVDGDSTIFSSTDGLSARLRSADTDGDTNITVTADADLGSGVQEISEDIRLTVIDPMAAGLGPVAGAPTVKT